MFLFCTSTQQSDQSHGWLADKLHSEGGHLVVAPYLRQPAPQQVEDVQAVQQLDRPLRHEACMCQFASALERARQDGGAGPTPPVLASPAKTARAVKAAAGRQAGVPLEYLYARLRTTSCWPRISTTSCAGILLMPSMQATRPMNRANQPTAPTPKAVMGRCMRKPYAVITEKPQVSSSRDSRFRPAALLDLRRAWIWGSLAAQRGQALALPSSQLQSVCACSLTCEAYEEHDHAEGLQYSGEIRCSAELSTATCMQCSPC